MRSLVQTTAGENMALIMAVRLEDARQRHPNDRAPELPAAAVRTLLRTDPGLRLLITHADRSFVEEVHFGSTPEESARIWWDICWIWGPRRIIWRHCCAPLEWTALSLNRPAASAAGEQRRQAGPSRPEY